MLTDDSEIVEEYVAQLERIGAAPKPRRKAARDRTRP
jgi:hypothetical protein